MNEPQAICDVCHKPLDYIESVVVGRFVVHAESCRDVLRRKLVSIATKLFELVEPETREEIALELFDAGFDIDEIGKRMQEAAKEALARLRVRRITG